MNFLKVKTSVSCFVFAAIIVGACEEEHEPLPPPQPASSDGSGGFGGNIDEKNLGGEGGILIDSEVPTCLENNG